MTPKWLVSRLDLYGMAHGVISLPRPKHAALAASRSFSITVRESATATSSVV